LISRRALLGVFSEGIQPDASERRLVLLMVAATIAGSRVSFAKPCVKTFVLERQVSAAAFIDGAATARSKKPDEFDRSDDPSRHYAKDGELRIAIDRKLWSLWRVE